MKLLLVNVFFFVMVLSSVPGYARNNIGAALLNAFQCNAPDSETSKIRNSIQGLRNILDSTDNNECQSIKDTIARVPDINNLLNRVQTDRTQQRLKELEETIATTLAEIEMVKGLPGDEQALYPRVEDLSHIVITSRAQLLSLKASLGIQASEMEKQNEISGIEELNTLGENLANALNSNSECFEGDNSPLRTQSLIALAGIAGYFMEAPLGVATTLISRNVQNLYKLFKNRASKKWSRGFNSLDLGFGIGCAVERLSNQHCTLVKKEKLLGKLNEQDDTEANSSCTECEQQPNPHLLSRRTEQDLQTISNWVNEKDSSGGSNPDRQIIKDAAKTLIDSKTNQIIHKINVAINTAGQIVGNNSDDVKKDKTVKQAVRTALAEFANLISSEGGGRRGDSGLTEEQLQQVNYEVQGNLRGQRQIEIKILELLMGERSDEIYNKLIQEYQENKSGAYDSGGGFGGGFGGGGNSGNYLPPITKMLKLSLPVITEEIDPLFSQVETLRKMAGRVREFQKESRRRLKTGLSPEDERKLATRFMLSEESSQRSVQDSLINIQEYLEFAEVHLRDSPAASYIIDGSGGVKALKEKVDVAIVDTNKGINNNSNATEIITAMNTLVGENMQFSTNITDVIKQVQLHGIKNMSELGSAGISMYSQEIIRDALNISTNIELVAFGNDVHTAKTYSETLLIEFSKFISNSKKQLQELLGGDKISEHNKNQLCIQLIGLANLNDKKFRDIKNSCTGRKVTDPRGNKLTFDSMVNKPLEQRVCALQMFKNNMDRPMNIPKATQ